MPVEGVITVSVPVTDQGRALAFYVGTLGLKLARMDETMLGVRRVHVTGNGTTCLSLETWGAPMPPGCLRGLILRSSDLAADYQRLVAAGVEFDGPPFAGPDGTCQAVCYDPDGNALTLQGGSTAPAAVKADTYFAPPPDCRGRLLSQPWYRAQIAGRRV